MAVKVTPSAPPKVKRTAAMQSKRRKKNISALVVELLERGAAKEKVPFACSDGIGRDYGTTADELR